VPLVALSCLDQAVIVQRLDGGVVEEDMELALSRSKPLDGGLDRGQVGEVEVEEDQQAFGLRPGLLDVGDGALGFVLRAGCHVDLGVFGVEDLGDLLADARVGASDDVDLSTQVGHVLLGEGGLGRVHLRQKAGPWQLRRLGGTPRRCRGGHIASVMEGLESEEATAAVSLLPVINKERKCPGLFAQSYAYSYAARSALVSLLHCQDPLAGVSSFYRATSANLPCLPTRPIQKLDELIDFMKERCQAIIAA